MIRLDIEVPEIAVALREHRPDLLLVPSATENLLDLGQGGRCADARAVEFGCHVGLCHLTGVTNSVLVDENIGKLVFFSPSQSPFLELDRSVVSGLFREGCHQLSISVETGPLDEIRALTGGTDPSKLRPDKVGVVISD